MVPTFARCLHGVEALFSGFSLDAFDDVLALRYVISLLD